MNLTELLTIIAIAVSPMGSVVVGYVLTAHLKKQDERMQDQILKVDETHKAVNSRYDELERRLNVSDAENVQLKQSAAIQAATDHITAKEGKTDG